MTSIPLTEAWRDWSEAMRRAAAGPVMLTRHGAPALVLMTAQAYLDLVTQPTPGPWKRPATGHEALMARARNPFERSE